MTLYETTIAKIQQMPEPKVREVEEYVDYLLSPNDAGRWKTWKQFAEGKQLAETDLSDYLGNLEAYEDRLAKGQIRW